MAYTFRAWTSIDPHMKGLVPTCGSGGLDSEPVNFNWAIEAIGGGRRRARPPDSAPRARPGRGLPEIAAHARRWRRRPDGSVVGSPPIAPDRSGWHDPPPPG